MRTTNVELVGADAIEEFLRAAYGRTRISTGNHVARLRSQSLEAGSFFFDRLTQSTTVDFQAEGSQRVVICWASEARIRCERGREDHRFDPGDVFLVPQQALTGRMLSGSIKTCVIDAALLARVAATAPDRCPGPIRFTSMVPRAPAAGAHWISTRSYVEDLLNNPEVASAPLLVNNAARLLAAAALTTFPNTAFTDPTVADRRDASSATVRRAVAFLDDHATGDVSVADIAASAGVSIRAVQLAFRRRLDTTPMAYLRRVRLRHAHQELVDADPTRVTVSAVAARWGFPSHSRFTATYRQTYGVTPTTTLRAD